VPTSAELAWGRLRPAFLGPGFEADEFFTAEVAMYVREGPTAAAARFSALRAEMVRKIAAEPGVTAVTMSEFKPFEERNVDVEVDLKQDRKSVAFNQVDSAFFDAFGIPLLAGRRFEAGDSQASAILVNRSFANLVLAGGDPLGRPVRVVNRDGTATRYQIVGFVGDQFSQSSQPTIYRPLAPVAADVERGANLTVRLAMHTGSPIPPGFANRLREIAATLDPALRIDDLQTLDEIHWYLSLGQYIQGSGLVVLALGIIVFSVAGIYTLMAFAVVQRRREIGIRSALGASPLRLVLGIFRQVLIPVSVGVALGGLTALLLDFYWSPLLFVGEGGRPLPWILPAAEAFVLLVGVLAVFGPTRRVLGIDPLEAMRES
jgi:hypothetical protein